MMFVRAYPCETQEMVFDAHDRMIGRSPSSAHHLHNTRTAAETVFVGKGPAIQSSLPPAGGLRADIGLGEGQVENHVGQVRCGAIRIHDRPGYLGRQSFAGPCIPPPNTAVARTRKAPCE